MLHNGPINSEEEGFKYVLIYTNMARNILFIIKLRGANLDYI
jgi:hypothetical protein